MTSRTLGEIKAKSANTISLIQFLYQQDDRPWVVGFSGGKDSTTVVQLIFEALKGLPIDKLSKQVYVLSSDTLVETPVIIDFIDQNLKAIEQTANQLHMPIKTVKVQPLLERTFWVLLIGKGYPTPRQKFRWCTDRLKIEPTNRFVLDRISEYGEVIMVMGVRKSESTSRAQVMQSHKISGRTLRKHSSLPNAYVFAPIEDWSTDDVWTYLLNSSSPWGGDNHALFALYKDSNAGECPLVIDKSTPSCGNSRFGCWVCTVVKEDKALMGLIESGREDLIPLLEYRNWLQEIRDNENYREHKRMNGKVYWVGTGEDRKVGLGPFTIEARKEMLRKLLKVQKEIGFSIISHEELKNIRRIWIDSGDWGDSLPQICHEIYGDNIDWFYDERPFLSEEDMKLLDFLCRQEDIPPELMRKLFTAELDCYGLKYRRNIFRIIDRIMKEDWIHVTDEGEEDFALPR